MICKDALIWTLYEIRDFERHAGKKPDWLAMSEATMEDIRAFADKADGRVWANAGRNEIWGIPVNFDETVPAHEVRMGSGERASERDPKLVAAITINDYRIGHGSDLTVGGKRRPYTTAFDKTVTMRGVQFRERDPTTPYFLGFLRKSFENKESMLVTVSFGDTVIAERCVLTDFAWDNLKEGQPLARVLEFANETHTFEFRADEVGNEGMSPRLDEWDTGRVPMPGASAELVWGEAPKPTTVTWKEQMRELYGSFCWAMDPIRFDTASPVEIGSTFVGLDRGLEESGEIVTIDLPEDRFDDLPGVGELGRMVDAKAVLLFDEDDCWAVSEGVASAVLVRGSDVRVLRLTAEETQTADLDELDKVVRKKSRELWARPAEAAGGISVERVREWQRSAVTRSYEVNRGVK